MVKTMRAMVLDKPGAPLSYRDVNLPDLGCNQIRVRVTACGVCRTDLHVVDGELAEAKLPIIPGHEIVGLIDGMGEGLNQTYLKFGMRVGIPWLGKTCENCYYCKAGHENLCKSPSFTGYQIDGGYAEYAITDAKFCFPLPHNYTDVEAAPLMCAGSIGYRCLRKAGILDNLQKTSLKVGIYGFGAAAHIITQILVHWNHRVYAFTREEDYEAQSFARSLGCHWAGSSEAMPPEPLDAAIIFAPVGRLVPAALRASRKGGIVVTGGIHMTDIPSFPYSLLWGERHLLSVSNLTRQDGFEFLALAEKVKLHVKSHVYPLKDANKALDDLKHGRFSGAAVLTP